MWINISIRSGSFHVTRDLIHFHETLQQPPVYHSRRTISLVKLGIAKESFVRQFFVTGSPGREARIEKTHDRVVRKEEKEKKKKKEIRA